MSLQNSASVPGRRLQLRLLGVGVVLYFFANLHRVAVPGSIFNELQMSFAASASAVAMTGAIFMYAYALIQLVIGLLADKYGGNRVILGGSILFAAGALLFPFSPNLGWLYVSRALIGVGCGSIYLCLVKESDRLFPHNFTGVLGWIVGIGYIGGVAGALPLGIAAGAIGWRWTFGILGAMLAVSLGIYWKCYQDVPREQPSGGKLSLEPIFATLRDRLNLRLLGVIAGGFGVYYAMLTVVGKKFLEDFCGASPAAAGACTSLMVIVSALTNVVTGGLGRYIGNRRLPLFRVARYLPVAAAAAMALSVLLGYRGSLWYIVMLLLFAVSAGFNPIFMALCRELNPPRHVGAAASLLNAAAYIGVAVVGNLAGMLMEFCGGSAAVHTADKVIYPASSYLAVLLLSLAVAAVPEGLPAVVSLAVAAGACRLGRRIPETFGKNITGES